MTLLNFTDKNASWEVLKKSCSAVNKSMLSLTGAATEMKAALLLAICFAVDQMFGAFEE